MAKRCKDLKTEVIATGREKYTYQIFELMKRKEGLSVIDKNNRFNNTEIRLIAEVLAAQYAGKRLISTQLAQLLGVTRSAVSQIVNRLEEEGVVKRVADDVDRKIAYIEISKDTLGTYRADFDRCVAFVNNVIMQFGEEKFDKMHKMFHEFCDVMERTALALKNREKN